MTTADIIQEYLNENGYKYLPLTMEGTIIDHNILFIKSPTGITHWAIHCLEEGNFSVRIQQKKQKNHSITLVDFQLSDPEWPQKLTATLSKDTYP